MEAEDSTFEDIVLSPVLGRKDHAPKKRKKVPWYQFEKVNNPHTKSEYASACSDFLLEKMGKTSSTSYFADTLPTPPSHLYQVTKYTHNGFPELKCNNADTLTPSEEIQSTCSVFKYMFPMENLYVECAFCHASIPSTQVHNFFHDRYKWSAWIICCEKCASAIDDNS